MAVERQLDLFPSKPHTAKQRKALIQQRLDGLKLRQWAREEKRRLSRGKRLGGDTANRAAAIRQVTLDELIERNSEQRAGSAR